MIWKDFPRFLLRFKVLKNLSYYKNTGFPLTVEKTEMVKLLYMWVGYEQAWGCKA